ncbi:MAG: hypothetical protein ACLTMP_01195 [Eggerthella lenta]
MTGVTMRDRQRDHFLDRIAAVDPTLPSAIARHSATDTSATAPAQPRTAPSSARCASSTVCFAHVRHHRRPQALPTYGSADEPVLSM